MKSQVQILLRPPRRPRVIARPSASCTRSLRGELCDREGSFAPFAEERAAREAGGDPRRSPRERYGSRARYAEAVREAADALARDRLMLPEDAAAFAAAAAARPAGLPD